MGLKIATAIKGIATHAVAGGSFVAPKELKAPAGSETATKPHGGKHSPSKELFRLKRLRTRWDSDN
jgi:hypothetical protein